MPLSDPFDNTPPVAIPMAWVARLVATSNQNLAVALAGVTIDGVVVVAGDVVLLTGQTNAFDNGLWVAGATAPANLRHPLFNDGLEIAGGIAVSIQAGSNAGKEYELTTVGPITVGTTNLSFSVTTPVTAANLPAQYAAFDNNSPVAGSLAAQFGAQDNTAPGAIPAPPVNYVVAATTNNRNLGGTLNGATIDGVTLNIGDVLLVRAQTDPTENGIYVVSFSGATARHPLLNDGTEISRGIAVYVLGGSSFRDTEWELLVTGALVVGVSALNFSQMTPVAPAALPAQFGAFDNTSPVSKTV